MQSWYHSLLRFRVWSVEADVPSPPPRTQPIVHSRGSHALLKNRIGLQDTLSRQLVLNGFSRGALRQWTHRWPQRCQNRHRGYPEATYSIGSAQSAKDDVEGLPCVEKNPLQLPTDSREGSIVSLSPKIRILVIAYWTSAVRFFGKLLVDRPVLVANVRFCSFNNSGRSLIQFVANAASSCILR